MLRLYGPVLQRDAATSLPLQESLRSLLRSITMHEHDSLKYAEQNMFFMNFLAGQHAQLNHQHPLILGGCSVDSLEFPQFDVFRFDSIEQYIAENNLAPPSVPVDDSDWSARGSDGSDDEIDELRGSSKRSKLTSSIAKSASEDAEEEEEEEMWTSNWVDEEEDEGDDGGDDAEAAGYAGCSHLISSADSHSNSRGANRGTIGGSSQTGSHFVKLNGYSVEVVDVQAALTRRS